MSRRNPPRGRSAVVPVALLLALALVALAVVTVRDLAVAQGWTGGSPWLRDAVDGLDGLGATTAVVVAAAVTGLVGLVLLVLALKPAPVTHLPATADGDLWVSAHAVAALARQRADRSSGVVGASATVSRRHRVRVEVVAPRDTDQTVAGVRETVAADLDGFSPARISVHAQEAPR
ncbi:DUF6286 domain-containing protein [Nocardioides sp. Leaf374]|uniref:DUF6286 domain-containing protein n=1 Tax=Nocardioides sp. Leaf374 TaxID=2876560 RepID=UPI001E3B4222|nr:DUF6286 domain-containing protein [Nocardioides sp. Leaf374]